MRIEKTKNKILCDFGACKRESEFVIRFEGMSSYSDMNICHECARVLSTQLRYALRGKRDNAKE